MQEQTQAKPWLKQPGEVVDRRGVPIYPGDLIRTFHFRERRKKHYLYHTAVLKDGGLWLVPTSHLEPTKVKGGGTAHLEQRYANEVEMQVISGCGPKPYLDFDDRPKKPVPQTEPGPRWAIAGTPI